MRRTLHASILATAGLCLLGLLPGCGLDEAKDTQVLRVGVIATLVEPARPWGLATVRCAQVVADHYNDLGGFDLGDRKVMIELVVKDDQYDPSRAEEIAHELVMDGVKYVIGPLGDDMVSSVARILDAASVFYVHYGFNLEMLRGNSLGVLGMPMPEQSLPVLFKHLHEEEGVSSILTMAYGSEEGIRQKKVAEYMAGSFGFDLVKLSRFDVSEEAFDLELGSDRMRERVGRIVDAAPDALILTGCPPEFFIGLVDHLRSGGYRGFICTQNFQEPRLLAQLGAAADGVFFVGGMPPSEARSDYYESLKARYMDMAGGWSEEADVKLYALEFILACLRQAGPDALGDTTPIYSTLAEIEFKDPFYRDDRLVPVEGGNQENSSWQLRTPIRISKMSGGQTLLVAGRRPNP